MADPALCKYLKALTIEANLNDDLRAESDGGAFTCTIAAGTYYVSGDGSASDLLTAIQSALNGADPGTVAWTLSLSSNKVNVARSPNTNAAYLYGAYSASGFNAFDTRWLGFDTVATETIGATVDSIDADSQFPGGWYSTQAIANDPLPYYYDNEITQAQSKSGAVTTVQVGSLRQARDISHAYEPTHKAYPVTGYENESWLAFISNVSDGSSVRYYPDVSVTHTYWTGVFDRSNLAQPKPERFSPGVAVYGWSVTLLHATETAGQAFPTSGLIHRFTLDTQVSSKYYCSIDSNVYLEVYGTGAVSHQASAKFAGGIKIANGGTSLDGGIGEDDTLIQGNAARLAIIPNGTQAFSFGIWVFVPTFNPDSRLPGYEEYMISFGNPGGSDSTWAVYREVNDWNPGGDDGKFKVYSEDTLSTRTTSTAATALTDNAWHHVLLTRGGTSMVVYLDGASYINHTCSATLLVSGGAEFQIGGRQTDGFFIPNDFWFDHCEVWDRALDATEAAQVAAKTW